MTSVRNGSEFINDHLKHYCEDNQITFTRSRPHRKNDSCFVEQKNWTAVRQMVGYLRYDTDAELKVLNELYRYLRLYHNFFQPQMKLIEKTRNGSKLTKRYDQARTPYQRLIQSTIPAKAKKALKEQYFSLNPVQLKKEIVRCQDKLLRIAARKRQSLQSPAASRSTSPVSKRRSA